MNLNLNDKLVDLILKSFKKDLAAKEEKVLSEWLEKDEKRQQWYEGLSHNWKEEVKAFDSINTDAVWEKIEAKTKKPASTKVRRLNQSWLGLAASLVILITCGLFIYPYLNKERNSLGNFGQPGSQQAYLNIENQNEIFVSPEISSQIELSDYGILQSQEGELRYDLQQGNNVPKAAHNLKVPKGGEYKIVLADGTKVWLNAETNLRYPSAFDEQQRLVYLEGEAYFEVTKDSIRPFIVKTDKMDIEVLGTAFNVSAYPEEETYKTTLIEGKVNINEHSGNQQVLHPGQQFNLSIHKLESKVLQVDTKLATDWKDGKYIFQNENLEDILKQLSKWYNLEYEFSNDTLRKMKYSGSAYKNEPIKKLLDAISLIRPIEFKIKNGKLQVQDSANGTN